MGRHNCASPARLADVTRVWRFQRRAARRRALCTPLRDRASPIFEWGDDLAACGGRCSLVEPGYLRYEGQRRRWRVEQVVWDLWIPAFVRL